MKKTLILIAMFSLSACTRTELAPKMVMPAPPEILMRAPKPLTTINTTVASEEESPEDQ